MRKIKTINGLHASLDRSLCPFEIPRSDEKKGILTMDDYELAVNVFDGPDGLTARGVEPHSVRCIEMDNPWQLKGFEQVKKYRSPHLRPTRTHWTFRLFPRYPTMSLPALWLFNENLSRMAAPRCHLWAWTIKDMLPYTFQLYTSWGWQYKQMYTWVKTYGEEIDTMDLEELPEEPPHCGGGYWGRNACEYLLFFVNPARDNRPMNAPRERNVFYAPIGEHSAKPEIAYEVIRRNSPGPRVSLFQRSHRDGFVPWGNQAPVVTFDKDIDDGTGWCNQ